MSKPFRTLDDADVAGKRVLLRVDLNVPTENGKVTDTTRIERVASTITEIADKGGKVILLAHFGRPEGRTGRGQFAAARRRRGRRRRQAAGRLRDRLHRRGRRRRHRQDEERRHPAAREHPLLQGRGKERSGSSSRNWPSSATSTSTTPSPPPTAPTPRPRASRTSCRPIAGRAMQAELEALTIALGNPGAAGRGDRRRREGLDQARTARQSDQEGRRPDHRRRHGQHLPVRRRARRSASRCARRTWPTPRARSWRRRKRPGAASCCRSTRWSPRSSRRTRHARVVDVDHVAEDEMILDIGPKSVVAIEEVARQGQDAGVERPVRRVRDAAVRGGDLRASPRPSASSPATASSRRSRAAATRSRRSTRPASPASSPMSRRRAAHSSNGWKARRCRASRRCAKYLAFEINFKES